MVLDNHTATINVGDQPFEPVHGHYGVRSEIHYLLRHRSAIDGDAVGERWWVGDAGY